MKKKKSLQFRVDKSLMTGALLTGALMMTGCPEEEVITNPGPQGDMKSSEGDMAKNEDMKSSDSSDS